MVSPGTLKILETTPVAGATTPRSLKPCRSITMPGIATVCQ